MTSFHLAQDAEAKLKAHKETFSQTTLRTLFENDANRFKRFSIELPGFLVDYSRNRLTDTTQALLLAFAEAQEVRKWRDKMQAGETINLSEQRAALHLALRAPAEAAYQVNRHAVMPQVETIRQRMKTLTQAIRSGTWVGYTGQRITDIVNIGIGGSDLGPKMVVEALATPQDSIQAHFISNIDGQPLDRLLQTLNPETTLFIIVSKSFSTPETLMNAQAVRAWFLNHAEESAIAQHFIAVSTQLEATAQFGIPPENVLGFWDWVGGRYSVWSAVGLSIALACGWPVFETFLAGGHEMDTHFLNAPLEQNMPVILGLLGFWHHSIWGAQSHAVIPYCQALESFPAYLQQLEMESNGKSVSRTGEPLSHATGAVVWGSVGVNGQHAFFQLFHQGTQQVPIDFILPIRAHHTFSKTHQPALIANCLAQAEALMKGKTLEEVQYEMQQAGYSEAEIERLAPHRTFSGNRSSNLILLEALTPRTLGMLLALYEHKTFVQSILWGINPFDQWGVEYGKALAKTLEPELACNAPLSEHDSSTLALIHWTRHYLHDT